MIRSSVAFAFFFVTRGRICFSPTSDCSTLGSSKTGSLFVGNLQATLRKIDADAENHLGEGLRRFQGFADHFFRGIVSHSIQSPLRWCPSFRGCFWGHPVQVSFSTQRLLASAFNRRRSQNLAANESHGSLCKQSTRAYFQSL